MAAISSSDRSYCEKLACIPGSVFSTSYRFAKPSIRDSLLSSRALVNEIRGIPFTVSDPAVAMAKIAWWRNELVPRSISVSQHPVVRAVRNTGVLESQDQDDLNDYFVAISNLSSGEPVTSVDQLTQLAERVEGFEVLFESGAGVSNSKRTALAAIGVAGFLNRMLHDMCCSLCAENWWLPLDIQAKYGITLGTARKGSADEELKGAVKELSRLALDSLHMGMTGLQEKAADSARSQGVHHLMIRSRIIDKRLTNLNAKPHHHNLRTARISEVYTAWRQAVRG